MDSLSLLPDGKKRQNELKFGSYDLDRMICVWHG